MFCNSGQSVKEFFIQGLNKFDCFVTETDENQVDLDGCLSTRTSSPSPAKVAITPTPPI